ncbi:MAG: thiamine pyrophosphate-dependent enzyme [bacterium]|nr:thiamine pyrophosphate-dependent enzyme [bacterium]
MEKAIFKRPESLYETPFHYCPGCGHGIIHRLIAEVIDEFGIRERTIGTAPVGCAVLNYDYFNFDVCECAHGRTPAVATGIKRVRPKSVVFSYQGDGDLAAIGIAEIIHTALRSERITAIFVNNCVYGMTGGQMAPTTLLNQKTQTTPFGRDPKKAGFPLRVCELLATLDGATYIARTALNNPKNVLKTRESIKKAFLTQIEDVGFSLVEILSPCPVNWKLSPVDSIKWMKERMIPYFPLGEFKTPFAK